MERACRRNWLGAVVLGMAAMVVGWSAGAGAAGFRTITFPSEDGLAVTADLYRAPQAGATFIILYHRAGWSRGEYREIAPRLAAMGYNCLAVDQRSGYAINGVVNETAMRAARAGKAMDFLAAYQDMEAALEYVRRKLRARKVVVWGSSYSASLVLILAAHHPSEVAAVVAFSPGEYFTKFGKSPHLIRDGVRGLEAPVFITSARSEAARWREIFQAIPSRRKVSFLPQGAEGVHGSQSLWSTTPGHRQYWRAVTDFLRRNAPPQ